MMRSAKERDAIRRRFRVLRVNADLNQQEAALDSQIEYYRYREIELGYALPTTKERARLATTFSVEPLAVSAQVDDRREKEQVAS